MLNDLLTMHHARVARATRDSLAPFTLAEIHIRVHGSAYGFDIVDERNVRARGVSLPRHCIKTCIDVSVRCIPFSRENLEFTNVSSYFTEI